MVNGRMLLLVVAGVLLVANCEAQYSYGQATYYNSIDHGYCGFGTNIPSNGFVAAWPFIETGFNGQGYAQPGANGQGCGQCMEVSCVPQYVESSDGSIYLDRRDACAVPNRAVVVRIVDECRCSLPRDSNLPRGNFNWCCNTPTPRLGINRHIDLSQQAFSALVRGGEYGLGIIGIRWRPTSCSSIGVVSINGGASTPATLPAPAASLAPQRPTTPPPTHNWHDNEALQTHEARENTQELPLLSQCGGSGGECAKYGPGNVCKDSIFPGYTCVKGLQCERQNQYYYQCLRPDRNNVNDGRNPVQATSGNNPNPRPNASTGGSSSSTSSSSSSSSKTLREIEQCGGKGAKCADYGACVDKTFPGYTCGTGLTCNRQNEWYWQCEKSKSSTPSGTSTPKSTSTPRPTGNTNNKPQSTPTTPTNGNTADNRPQAGQAQSPSRVQPAGQQCGGLGGDCAKLGGCVAGPLASVKCAPGLTCREQNKWFWECQA